jgi:nitroimidazol reductase NimA-like FMN-containing flavoprotein (pyridoxamine 5'-phosphate oxidase superfamily)
VTERAVVPPPDAGGGGEDRPAELFQLDRATCLALLRTQHVGRLVVGGDEAAVVPVNFTAVDEVITFRTGADGRATRSVPHEVLFEVDMFDSRTRSGWSVVVRGRLLAAPAGDQRAPVETWAPGDRDEWMTVAIEHVTGRLLRGAVEAPSGPIGGYL